MLTQPDEKLWRILSWLYLGISCAFAALALGSGHTIIYLPALIAGALSLNARNGFPFKGWTGLR